MFRLRNTVILVLSLLILSGSVGLNVFKHICRKDGVQVTFLVNTNTHCDDDTEMSCSNESPELPVCCQKEKESKKDDCCSDEVDHFKLKVEFAPDLESVSLPIFVASLSNNYFTVFKTDSYRVERSNPYPDPPPLEASRTRSLLQIYII